MPQFLDEIRPRQIIIYILMLNVKFQISHHQSVKSYEGKTQSLQTISEAAMLPFKPINSSRLLNALHVFKLFVSAIALPTNLVEHKDKKQCEQKSYKNLEEC